MADELLNKGASLIVQNFPRHLVNFSPRKPFLLLGAVTVASAAPPVHKYILLSALFKFYYIYCHYMVANVRRKTKKSAKNNKTKTEIPNNTKDPNKLKYKYGMEIIFYAGFLMWVLYLYGLEIAILFNEFNILQLAKVIFLMISLKYLFFPFYILGSKFMEITGAIKLAEAYRNEIKKAWTV